MSSNSPLGPSGHLDPTEGRDVVFCHACENEWFQDEHGLECPRCHSEATEVVTPDSDPRSQATGLATPALFGGLGHHPHLHHHDTGFDSDPDEADIDDLRPNGYFFRRNTTRGNAEPGEQPRTDPSGAAEVLRRFTEMLAQDFHVGAPGRSGPSELFPAAPEGTQGTWRTRRTQGPGGTTFTITTGSFGGDADGGFESTFRYLMDGVPAPGDREGAAQPTGQPPNAFATSLQALISSILDPAHFDSGDYVHSQEALDDVITGLMNRPQHFGPPPSSQNALDKLERKALDQNMAPEGKAECSICIEDVPVGDKVLVLPCKHWFHEECGLGWLKAHNTCPHCRQPIEGETSQPTSGEQRDESHNEPQNGRPLFAQNLPGLPPLRFASFAAPNHLDRPLFPQPSPGPSGFNSGRERHGRTTEENEQRLNSIRNLAGQQGSASTSTTDSQQRLNAIGNPTGPGQRGSSATRRRDSMSPPSPSHFGGSETSRARQRSPPSSRSGRDNNANNNNNNNPNHNPINWLRERFSSNGNRRGPPRS